MSKLDDTIQTVEAVREHYHQAAAQILAAISESDEGITQGEALGFEAVIEVFAQAKQALEELSQTTDSLTEQIDAIVGMLQAGKG